MQIVLLKNYKPHSRELKAGTQMGVTNEVGLKLIEEGIAKLTNDKEVINIVKKQVIEEPIEVVEEPTETKEPIKERKNKKNN